VEALQADRDAAREEMEQAAKEAVQCWHATVLAEEEERVVRELPRAEWFDYGSEVALRPLWDQALTAAMQKRPELFDETGGVNFKGALAKLQTQTMVRGTGSIPGSPFGLWDTPSRDLVFEPDQQSRWWRPQPFVLVGRVPERIAADHPFPAYTGPNIPVCEQPTGSQGASRPLRSDTHLRLRMRRHHRPKTATVARAAHAETFSLLDATRTADELKLYVALTDPIVKPSIRAAWRAMTADLQTLAGEALEEAGYPPGYGGSAVGSDGMTAMAGGTDAAVSGSGSANASGDAAEAQEPLDVRGLSRTAIG